MRKLRIVEIEWNDAYAGGGWKGFEEHRKEIQAGLPVYTTGYLIKKTKRAVRVLQSVNLTDSRGADHMTIPMSCVRKIRRLK